MNGFIGIIKPRGISSACLLNQIKWALRKQNDKSAIGHMGTLDLEASGVLVVAIGKATRLFNYFLNKEKTYKTVFQFGIETDTLDYSGNIVIENQPVPTKEQISSVLAEFVGKQEQIPPIFSAKKIGGECAYLKARRNEEVVLKPKQIEIFDFDLLGQKTEDSFSFKVSCSSGTYIRALARDVAKRLGTRAIALEIDRIKSGFFTYDNCINAEEISYENITKNLIMPQQALPWIEVLEVSLSNFKDLLDGKEIFCNKKDGIYFAKTQNNDIMLVNNSQNKMKILVNLKE